ncbi:DUF4013 domain-containing protein [Methanobrevibacter sp.]|uniref:DUF4013 domain-containing protein n=1 Tax=Methanobrevibacter sp. TaxID=66852 RepID=UPI00388F07D4
MSISEIISDAIRYPFSDITKFLIIGIIALLAGFANLLDPFDIDGFAMKAVFTILSIIFSLMLSGIGLNVIKNAIAHSDEIPVLDPVNNILDGIKFLIVSIVYFLIPMVITFVLAIFFGVLGAGLNHIGAATAIVAVIAIVLFIIFGIFQIIAIARLAKTGDFGAAFDIGAVLDDVKKIGIGKIILFLIISLVIIMIAALIASFLAIIPFIGLILSQIVIGAFVVLFYYRGIGLIYSEA